MRLDLTPTASWEQGAGLNITIKIIPAGIARRCEPRSSGNPRGREKRQPSETSKPQNNHDETSADIE